MEKIQINFHAQKSLLLLLLFIVSKFLKIVKKKILTLSVVVQTIKREDFFVFKLTFTWYVV
jgi:hypothetical protein